MEEQDVPDIAAALESPATSPFDGAATSAGETTDTGVLDMLQDGVPLSLLMDLSAPAGPDSEAIFGDEGEPGQQWWQPA